MGYRIKNYTRDTLRKIALPGNAASTLFWVVPLGNWDLDQIEKLWRHFTKTPGTACNDVGLLIVRDYWEEREVRNDQKTGATICKIFEVFLSDSCNGIMYWSRDDDAKGYKREMKFDRWFDFFCTSDKIERFAQEFCDEECLKYYLLVDKGCTNYPIVVHDYNHRCRNCSGTLSS